jgi:hypothetical protein
MKSNTKGNDGQQTCISQQKHLSFYEENYILEPEDNEKDNGYFEYEGDDPQNFCFGDN